MLTVSVVDILGRYLWWNIESAVHNDICDSHA